MSVVRTEILPGVFVNCVKSDKFKTATLSVYLLTQHCKETASLNALVPFVLRRGTMLYPDMAALGNRLDELYGSCVEPAVRRFGEIQCIGLYSNFPENRYLPEPGENILSEISALLCDILLHPATKGGLFLKDYVESEKVNLINLIESRINNKQRYALSRCIEEMCCYEDFGVGRYGTSDDVEAINYKKLSKHYKSVLSCAPVEVIYCGSADPDTVNKTLKESLIAMPRGEIDWDIGTDVRMNSVEPEARFVSELGDVNQAKLVMGFRLGECMEDVSVPALQMFSGVFGSCTSSKLFMNVRERLSLCYYTGSMIDSFKGLLLVSAGIEKSKYDTVREEILRQLDTVCKGEISDEEFEGARKTIISSYLAAADSQSSLESHYLSEFLRGSELAPEDYAGMVDSVTKEEIAEVANSVELDLIYLLSSAEETENA